MGRDDDDDPEEDAAARLEWSTKMMGNDADLKSMGPKLKWVSPLSSAISLSSNKADTNMNMGYGHAYNGILPSTVTIEKLTEEEDHNDNGLRHRNTNSKDGNRIYSSASTDNNHNNN